MANYTAVSRTNYFQVTDEETYRELFDKLAAEDEIHDFSCTNDGKTYHGFGCYGSIEFCEGPEDDEEFTGMEGFAEKLKAILPENEAFIYQETGNEKLRYLTAFAVVATREHVKFVSLDEQALICARFLLGDPKWETQTTY